MRWNGYTGAIPTRIRRSCVARRSPVSVIASVKKLLAFGRGMPKYLAFRTRFCGPVAQLEERLNGIEEVVSSILIGSTNLLI